MSANIGVYDRGDEALYAVVNVADDSTTVLTGPGILVSVFVNTALSAHALPIKDGATTVFTLPASAAAGTRYPLGPVKFGTSIVVDPNDAATGNITLVYRRIN